jgi:type I restriction enzyme R subunit
MNSGLYLIGNEIILYDKKELIQKFIKENMSKMINGQSVQTAFAQFWGAEKEQAYQHLCAKEKLKHEAMQQVQEHYEFTQRLPCKEEPKDLPNFKVKLFERENVLSNLLLKTRKLIEKFYVGFKKQPVM